MLRLIITYPQVKLFVVGLVAFMLRWASIYLMYVRVFNLQGITLNESRKLFKQLLCQSITLKLV